MGINAMAVEDIRISLQLLAETVENLEKEIDAKELAAKQAAAAKPAPGKNQPQIDMFGGWTAKPVNDKNSALLAKKLDNTIDKVQNLLKQARAV